MLGIPWEKGAEATVESFATDLDAAFALRADLEAFCRGAASIEIIGRGAAYGGAIMGALTIREMSGSRAVPHTGAGVKHGLILDVDASHVAIIFALGRAAALGFRLAAECHPRGGGAGLSSDGENTPSPRQSP